MRYDALYSDSTQLRPALHTLLHALQPYDTLFLLTEAHLSRSLRYALPILHALADRNITVHVLRNNVAYAGKNSLYSSIPENAPEVVRKLRAAFFKRRCKGGIDRAHREGMCRVRKKKPLPKNFKEVAERVRNKEINFTVGAELCKMAYTTFVHEVHMLEENPPQYHKYQRKQELTEAEPGTLEHYIDRGMSFNDTMLAMYDDGKMIQVLRRLPRNALELLLELFQVFHNYKAREHLQMARQSGTQIGRKKIELPSNFTEVAQRYWQGEITGLIASAKVKMAYRTFMRKADEIAREKKWGEKKAKTRLQNGEG